MEESWRKWWGHPSLWAGQKTLVQSVLRGVDVIGSMAPGSGKSVASQFPAVFLSSSANPSFSLILSPLRTTLRKHFDALTSLGISVSISTEPVAMVELTTGCLHLMTPEAFSNSIESIKRLCESSRLVSVVIEDAHLISHPRNSSAEAIYRQIRLWFPQVPIVALVDIRHPSLLANITNTLGLRSPQIVRTSLNRPNVFFSVKCLSAVSLGEYLAEFYCQFKSTEEDGRFQIPKRSVLIVANTFSDGQKISSVLSSHPTLLRLGIRCDHQQSAGGADILSSFNRDLTQILIVTHSLDFDLLKPDIQLVVRVGLPSSLEDFYRLSCRAGRDGLPCTSLLAHEPFERNSLSPPYDPTLVFCSEIACRRHYLLRYLETEDSSLPGEEIIAFDGCCDACDRRLVGKEQSKICKKSPKELKEISPTSFSISSTSSELEKALRVTRFDLCQQVGESAPYNLLSSEEIKLLSVLRPQSLEELPSQFGWSEQKVGMIGKEILRCIQEYSGDKGSYPSPSNGDSRSHVDGDPMEERSVTCLPLCTGATSPAELSDKLHQRISVVEEQPHLSSILSVHPLGVGSMKRRRTEAVNAACGVVRRAKPGPKLKRTVSLPLATEPHLNTVPRSVPNSLQDLPGPKQQTRDWEREVLEFLQRNGRLSLTEILTHFSRSGSTEQNHAIANQEIRAAVRSLGERCCLYLDEGKYCASI